MSTNLENLFPPQLSLNQQLVAFADRSHEDIGARTWLKDSDNGFTAYVRTTRKPLGLPTNFYTTENGELVPIPSQAICLEVADLERLDSPEPPSLSMFTTFMSTVFSLKRWGVVCLDNLGDPLITQWCREHGWTQDERQSPDFFYIQMPTD